MSLCSLLGILIDKFIGKRPTTKPKLVLGVAQLAKPEYTTKRWYANLTGYSVLSLATAASIWARDLLGTLGEIMITTNELSFVVVICVILATSESKASSDLVKFGTRLGLAATLQAGWDSCKHSLA